MLLRNCQALSRHPGTMFHAVLVQLFVMYMVYIDIQDLRYCIFRLYYTVHDAVELTSYRISWKYLTV